jgi:hypothetical protein
MAPCTTGIASRPDYSDAPLPPLAQSQAANCYAKAEDVEFGYNLSMMEAHVAQDRKEQPPILRPFVLVLSGNILRVGGWASNSKESFFWHKNLTCETIVWPM